MPEMFPSMYRPEMQNNRPTSAGYPISLTVSFFLFIGTAILMMFAGLVLATSGYQGELDVDPSFRAAVVRNQRIVAVFNIVIALVVAVLASQLRRGSTMSRRWLAVVVLVAVIGNLLAFVVKAGGFVLGIIPVLLAFAALLMYTQESNAYVEKIRGGHV
ncbi:hypothetical protein ACX3U9_10490 [Corynebacterium pyruviciproducens]|uniref:hypothetical protein n=1 Tax=Corynebacterium pyruviciproducens TaxID=598660 RepID=UPI002455C833|nr:hypothetical protein [Corynebacterium pyruviciproducens]MDH4657418.1 hypothetical protein [Corynebacterium pyruviciproducens]